MHICALIGNGKGFFIPYRLGYGFVGARENGGLQTSASAAACLHR